jgi:guanosine-3',5'-bis(diphosphate) 3'-pyrophosphohydrolase
VPRGRGKGQGHIWQQAAAIAARAHRGQYRKDGITPYFSHTVRVAMTIACVFGFEDEHILAAALLHDTIEDCGADYDEVFEHFGKDVADYVAAMSKDMRMIEPAREKAYDAQLAAGPWQARLIKLADVYDNLHDSINNPRRAEARGKVLDRARRILKLTKNDRQLAAARGILERVVKSL